MFIRKYRRKALYGELRRHLGKVFHWPAEQKQSRVEEGHLMPGHVQMMGSIVPLLLGGESLADSGPLHQQWARWWARDSHRH